MIRRKFRIEDKAVKTRLYVCSAGLFEAYLDGNKIGEEYLTPYTCHYESRIQAITMDPGEILPGEHTLDFLLGKGWYMGTFGLEGTSENFGNRMAVIAELHMRFEDGREEEILTDDSFMSRCSDIIDSGIYLGEILDRSNDIEENENWKPVQVISDPMHDPGTLNLNKDHIRDRISLPVYVKEHIPVKKVISTPAGETVLDFGQNFAGYVEFTAVFPKNTKIIMDFGEILQEGNFYNKNYREAKSRFTIISSGKKETIHPHFTYFGFRYVRITGWIGELDPSSFSGEVLYSDMDRTGFLHTFNERINRLFDNTLWGLKSNFIDMPTDCPQRSERLGWTGDAQIFAPTACYHMDTRAFYRKYLTDLRAEQLILNGAVPNYIPNITHKSDSGSVWGDAATIIPSTLYQYYGNKKDLELAYPMMRDWVEYIDQKDGQRGVKKYLFDFGFHFGDWLALDGATESSFKGSTDDTFLASVYYYNSAKIVAKAANILGESQDEQKYEALSVKIRDSIFHEYFTPSGRLAIDTQTALIIALKFGVYIEREKLVAQLRHRFQKDLFRIKGGFVGAPLMCTVLGEIGMPDTAYDFLFNEEFPGWIYEVNLGATTIWERWNSVLEDGMISSAGMNSLNHYAYGSVMEFVYAYALGIRPQEPGFKKAIIAPHPDIRLKELSGMYDSVSGKYECRWSINEDGSLFVKVTIPFQAEAELILPDDPEERRIILPAGEYEYLYFPKKDYRKPFDENTILKKLVYDSEVLEIFRKELPQLYGIAMEKDPEMLVKSLRELGEIDYLPLEKARLEKVIKKVSEIVYKN